MINRLKPALAAAICTLFLSAPLGAADDERELVKLPAMMQQHMMANMRDHLAALNDALAALAKGDIKAAGKAVETRLGMSSMQAHGAAHMAPYMPKAMAALGTGMHRAASRFVIAVENAELSEGREGERKVYQALSDITSACVACHTAYRIR